MMYRANLNRTLSLTYVSVSFFFSYMMPPLSLPVFVVHVLNTCPSAISISHYACFSPIPSYGFCASLLLSVHQRKLQSMVSIQSSSFAEYMRPSSPGFVNALQNVGSCSLVRHSPGSCHVFCR